MNLHSNSLFHFTRKEHLINILSNIFIPHYCKERLSISDSPFDYRVPMVSFCDIPLSYVQDHIVEYGKYAIGLNREWVNRNKLNPVLYYRECSVFFKKYHHLLKSMMDNVKNAFPADSTPLSEYYETKYLFTFFKPYEGFDFKTNTEKIFFDEREWRYVPDDLLDDNYMIPDGDERLQIMQKTVEQKKLSFEPKDVSYIIIEKEDERLEIASTIRGIKGKKYSHNDVETLVTKIISSEQILNDM